MKKFAIKSFGCLIVMCFMVMFFVGGVQSQVPMRIASIGGPFSLVFDCQKFPGLGAADRASYLRAAPAQWDNLEDRAVAQLNSPDDTVFAAAATICGEMRYEMAVGALVTRLDRRVATTVRTPAGTQNLPWGAYPARDAMAKLGWDAADFMVGELADKDDAVSRRTALDILLRIFSGDRKMAAVFIQEEAVDRTPSVILNVRINRALADLNAVPVAQ